MNLPFSKPFIVAIANLAHLHFLRSQLSKLYLIDFVEATISRSMMMCNENLEEEGKCSSLATIINL
jgi:hypothetical protein